MSAVDKILIAEETVAGLQSQLRTVETVLEAAEQVAATGEKAGRSLRRFLRVLLLLSVVAIVVMVVKKFMGRQLPGDDTGAIDSESVPDADVPDGDDAAPDGDVDTA